MILGITQNVGDWLPTKDRWSGHSRWLEVSLRELWVPKEQMRTQGVQILERVCIFSLPLASMQRHTNTHRFYAVWWFEGEKNSVCLQKILATSCSSRKKAKMPQFHTSLLLTCATLLLCLYLSHLKGIEFKRRFWLPNERKNTRKSCKDYWEKLTREN